MAEELVSQPQTIPGRDVFISYASHDKAVADAACKALESAGLTCWIAPRDVVPGESFAGAIVHAIDATRVIVLVLSEHAATSQHVLREVERASSKRHPLIAFRIDLAPMPADFEYFLNTSQWLDASTAGVKRALPKLVESTRSALALPPSTAPVMASPVAAANVTRRPTRMLVALAAFIVAALGYVVVDKVWLSKRVDGRTSPIAVTPASVASSTVAPVISEKSVAVLPFTDMSEKRDQEYLSDGLSEELINLLSKVPALRVPARTSSFYFKDRPEDIPTIARRLMVAHVLEGSVRKAGNHVRITVQLVRADNGYHLWSQTFDRTLNDIFKVQDEIATEIVRALKISLATDAVPRAAPTNNAEAHSLLLQAQFWDSSWEKDANKKAASYYQQAIDTDPGYAEAWVGLSFTLLTESAYAGQTWQHFRNLALHAAERAAALNPRLAEAHCALARVYYMLDWNLAAGNREYAMALSLNPGIPCALNGAGYIAAAQGRLSDALKMWEQCAAQDPLDYNSKLNIANSYYAMGRVTEALSTARKLEELDATLSTTHYMLAQMLLGTGQGDAALAEAQRVRDPGFRAYALARTYIVLGRRSDADGALAEFEKKHSTGQAYNIATLHALRGDRDQAFSWLERAYQQHDSTILGVPAITVDPDMKNLHDDPRWEAFLRKMKLLD